MSYWPDDLPPQDHRHSQVVLPNLINLTERDLFSVDGRHMLHIATHRDDYAEVELRVVAGVLPTPAEGLPSRIGLTFNDEYRIIRIQSWTYNTSPPTTGSRHRDQWGRVQTEILHQGVEYYEIRGTVEFPSPSEMRNPQTTDRSSSGGPSMPSVSSQSIPLESPPIDMLALQVICKWCRLKFSYPDYLDVDYFIDGSDRLGLVVCRACYNYQNGLEEGTIENPEKPKKKKNLYSRKLRIRRKE